MTTAPYTPPTGWPDFIATALARVPDDGRRDQARAVLDLCRRAERSLTGIYRQWRLWHGVPDGPNWLGYLTDRDWESFRLHCEHELAVVLNSNGKTVTT